MDQGLCNQVNFINQKADATQAQLQKLADIVSKLNIISIKQNYIAGAVINGGVAVIVDVDKKVYPFDILNPYYYDKYLGIAATGASPGEQVTVVTHGPSSVIGVGWLPGVGYYIGVNGFLTPIPPSVGLIKQVAVGVDNNIIIIENTTTIIGI